LLSPSLEVGAQNTSEQDALYRDPKNLDEENDNDKIQKEGQPVIRYDSSPVGAILNNTTRQFEIDSQPFFSPPSMNSEHTPARHTTHSTGHQRSLHQGMIIIQMANSAIVELLTGKNISMIMPPEHVHHYNTIIIVFRATLTAT
jgi:hypothetical protein